MENQLSEEEIEQEIEIDINESTNTANPFNPNKISIETKTLSIGQIVERLKFKEIMLFTEYQRLSNLWNKKKQSRLIESILLNLPIPAFYFDGKEKDKWRVIDGLQRISTFKNFIIDKSLNLEYLEFLKDFETNNFDELPKDLQRRITEFNVTVYILQKDTPDQVKYNIFSRINQGGLILEPQEMRHALHQGIAAELVADLVRGKDELDEDGKIRERLNHDGQIIKLTKTREGEAFIKVTEGKIKSDRMIDRDFATRFVSFYLIPYTKYNYSQIDLGIVIK